jgi:UDP-glucose 4-epimerase
MNLVKALSKKGFDVIGIDISNAPINNSFLGELDTEVRFVRADCRRKEEIDYMIEMCDACYHLAAQTNVLHSMREPYDDFSHNVIGSQNVIESCREHDTKMIFTSSFAVYGDSISPPIPEIVSPLNPISAYGLSKLITERLIGFYRKHFGLDATILRLSNVYGPMDFKSVIYEFLSRNMSDKTINVFGNGEQRRDFIHVNDVVDALILSSKSANGIYNICTGNPTSISQILSIIKGFDGEPNINFRPLLQGDIKDSWGDSSLARKSLGWESSIGIKEGLVSFNEWLRQKMVMI